MKAVEVPGEDAKLLADLTLHRSDMQMAKRCLEMMGNLPPLDGERRHVVSSALWRQAVTLFVKCFGKDARFRLDKRAIYPDEGGQRAFEFFYELRNKTFQHDANAYTQRHVLALLNDGRQANKVERLVSTNALFDVSDANNQRLMSQLIERAELWIAGEFDRLRDAVTADLEKRPYEELAKLPEVQIRLPTVEDMGKARR